MPKNEVLFFFFHFSGNEEIRISRECGYRKREGYECYQHRSDDFVLDVCQCTDSECNSGVTFGISAMALLVSSAIAAVL